MQSATLLLARTTETVFSRQRRFASDQDGELPGDGVAQARALASHLFLRGDVDVIACSGLRQAAATATIVAEVLGLPVVTLKDLREPSYGGWEGLTFTEVQAAWSDEMFRWAADPHTAPPAAKAWPPRKHGYRPPIGVLERFPHRTIVAVTHVTPDQNDHPVGAGDRIRRPAPHAP
ncbi:histidine phosphatase family protein [Spirillospora sp. NBC_00431]